MGSLVHGSEPPASKPAAATERAYEERSLEGWKLQIDRALLAQSPEPLTKALELLRVQLAEIVRVVPEPALARLREVTLWFSPEYPGVQATAEYHPGAGWLKANGRNPAMVKGVEFTNTRIFELETRRMPNFALHELAHSFHDRVLSFGNREIAKAYEHAKTAKIYDNVERWFGDGRPNTHERAYAMTNDREYFAESTEAFFSRNDFFPFDRAELERHDPEMAAVLKKLWGVEAK
jgi:hypothetical protein